MNFRRHLILASSSPRRQFLVRETLLSDGQAAFTFEVRKPDVEEDFPATMAPGQVPLFLANKKADFFKPKENEVILTADTIVVIGDKILNKPADRTEAIEMLSTLSGKTHHVYTGVCLFSEGKKKLFREETGVTFKNLKREEIEYYVDHFKPFDKAGSYGAQECLPHGMNPCSPDEIAFMNKINRPGLVETTMESKAIAAIDKISGSYFNVMGLPVHRVYYELFAF